MNSTKTDLSALQGNDSLMSLFFSGGETAGERCYWSVGPEATWIERIRKGLPGETVAALAGKLDVPKKDLAGWLHTTPRTLQRHIESGSNLSPDLSDRVAQLIRVYCRALEIFQDEVRATVWLKSPNYALGDISPTALLDTIPGIELVLDELGRIEQGVFI
jgi:putative toxin-antitoxin system antitoxin component (TIGR02293 family)